MDPPMLRLMHLPTLTQLRLIGAQNFPVSSLIRCTNIEQLYLECVEIVDESLATPLPLVEHVTVPKIKKLFS